MPGRSAPDRPLKVGLNLLFLGARAGGVGKYARELPGALLEADARTEVHVFVSRDAPADLRAEPWAEQVEWVALPVGPAGRATQLAQHALLPALALARRLDVLHSPANTGPTITPGVSSVVSLMDLTWLRRGKEWDPDPRAQQAMRRLVAHAVRHADRLFAISRDAANDFVRHLGVAEERIDVTPLGVRLPTQRPESETTLRTRLQLQGARVLLCVAQKRPYKNLERLVRALPQLDTNVVLVLPGAATDYERRLWQVAEEVGAAGRLRTPGWLSEAELAGLYAISAAFVLPSLAEGFGLPVLEAMAHGLPTACSDIPVLTEVVADAALRFDPNDQGTIDRALGLLLDDGELAERLRVRGLQRAREFTWKRTGEASLSGYRRAMRRQG